MNCSACPGRCLVRRHRSACLMRSFRSNQHQCLTTSIRLKTLKRKLPRHNEKRCLETSILHALKMEKKTKPSPKIIIETMLATGMTQAEAAEHFDVSTRWVRTLQARYREGGINALEPRSKRPRTNPRALNPNTVDRILELVAVPTHAAAWRPRRNRQAAKLGPGRTRQSTNPSQPGNTSHQRPRRRPTSNLRQRHRHCLQPLYGNTQRSHTLNPNPHQHNLSFNSTRRKTTRFVV